MNIKRVISIGAHSLDAELLGGPMMIRYARKGAHCTFINVTQGRLEDPNATEEEKKIYLENLLLQNKEAASTMGSDSMWLGYVSNKMPSLEEFSNKLEEYFIAEKVDLVFTHWRGSMHPRHINTHDAVVSAVKKLRKQGIEIKLMYGETFEDLVGFIPQVYIELTDNEVDTWFKALKNYQVFNGEINDFPYINYYTTNLKIRQIESDSNKFTVAYMYPSLICNDLY